MCVAKERCSAIMRLGIALAIVVGLALFLRRFSGNKSIVNTIMFVYVAAILIITLGTRKINNSAYANLDPFRVYVFVIRAIVEGVREQGWGQILVRIKWYKNQLSNVALNILLFVPFGCLLPSVSSVFYSWKKLLLVGFAVSLLIEVTQYNIHLGWFDTSDLFHNTIGTVIGFFIFRKIIQLHEL